MTPASWGLPWCLTPPLPTRTPQRPIRPVTGFLSAGRFRWSLPWSSSPQKESLLQPSFCFLTEAVPEVL